jgi:hypothetical protein
MLGTHVESQAPKTATATMRTPISAAFCDINSNGIQAGLVAIIEELILCLLDESSPTKKPTSNAVGMNTKPITVLMILMECIAEAHKDSFPFGTRLAKALQINQAGRLQD